MKTLHSRWQLTLAVVALMLAVVLPTKAARYRQVSVTQTAVFQVASTAKIAVGTNRSATLLALKIGDHVSIAYDQENGVLVAHHIADGVPPKPRNPSVNSMPVSHHSAKASVYKHVHGVVRSVDVQAGTLTIAYKPK